MYISDLFVRPQHSLFVYDKTYQEILDEIILKSANTKKIFNKNHR